MFHRFSHLATGTTVRLGVFALRSHTCAGPSPFPPIFATASPAFCRPANVARPKCGEKSGIGSKRRAFRCLRGSRSRSRPRGTPSAISRDGHKGELDPKVWRGANLCRVRPPCPAGNSGYTAGGGVRGCGRGLPALGRSAPPRLAQRTGEQANRRTAEQPNRRTGEQANRRTGRHANWQACKRPNTQTCKRARAGSGWARVQHGRPGARPACECQAACSLPSARRA